MNIEYMNIKTAQQYKYLAAEHSTPTWAEQNNVNIQQLNKHNIYRMTVDIVYQFQKFNENPPITIS